VHKNETKEIRNCLTFKKLMDIMSFCIYISANKR